MGGRFFLQGATTILAAFFWGVLWGPTVQAGGPGWWLRRNITAAGAAVDDFAPLNQGQLKHLALSAFQEIEMALPGGAGADLTEFIDLWTEVNNAGSRSPRMSSDSGDFSIVNIGQLKATAKLFYDRLVHEGLVRTCPWGWGTADDFAVANIGQAKALFAFEPEPGIDADHNGLPDLWELSFLGYTGVDTADDFDGDGVSNEAEFLRGTDPADYFNGVTPRTALVSGNKQEGEPSSVLGKWLELRVSDDAGLPLKNAPVVFELIKGLSGELSNPISVERGEGRMIVVRTNAEGIAGARFLLPSEDGFQCLVKASTGDGEPVFFEARTISKNSAGEGAFVPKIHTPEFALDGGEYLETVQVQMTCGTPGVVIRYTLDGEEPTEKAPGVVSEGFVEISGTAVLRARAYAKGMLPSETKSAAFRIGPAMSATEHHSIALDVEGTLWSWGDNGSGQLGLGHREEQSAPNPIQRLGDVVSVATGNKHGLAVLKNGKVVAWGSNLEGQLGEGALDESLSPSVVPGLPPVCAVAAGSVHSVALGKDGTVWSWGGNSHGQLGVGTKTDEQRPLRVGALKHVRAIAAGEAFSLALCADGTVWAWGDGASGQLANGTFGESALPSRVPGINDCIAICAGLEHALALRADGSVWAWGNNGAGQLGTGDTMNRSLPVCVNGLSEKVRSIAAAQRQSTALLSSATVMRWGDIGRAPSASEVSGIRLPQVFTGVPGVTGVSLGDPSLVLYSEWLKSVGRQAGGVPAGQSGVQVGADPRVSPQSEGRSFELRLQSWAEWIGQEEIYEMDIGVWEISEIFGVWDYWGLTNVEYMTTVYSLIFDHSEGDGFHDRYQPGELWGRVTEGTYNGPAATSFEELHAREDFWVRGDVELEVQITDPNFVKETKSVFLKTEYNNPAFFLIPGSERVVKENIVEVDSGSVIRFRCPSISSRTFHDYDGDERMFVSLSAILPGAASQQVYDNYLLFRQKDGGPFECILSHPLGASLEFNSMEKLEYLLCPVVLLQRNYPTSSGTTDLGAVEQRAILSGVNGASTAWIRGTGEMADLELRLGDGKLPGFTVEWAMDVSSERPEREDLDNFHLPASGTKGTLSLGSETPWKISEALAGGNRFVGGLCTVSYAIKNDAGKVVCPATQFKFRIRGKNPQDGDVVSHILGNPTHSRFAWAMVQHESRQSSKGVGRVYNQFNSGGPTRELPNFSGNYPKEDGWGISQLDKPLGKRANTEEVYNWKTNLATFQRELEQKQKNAVDYVNALRGIYEPQGLWEELPEPFIREGTVTSMSTLEAAVIQLYNGAAWLVEISKGKIIYDGPYTSVEHGGTRFISCWRFVPTNPRGARWEFKPNQNNYVYRVIRDEWEGNLWYQE